METQNMEQGPAPSITDRVGAIFGGSAKSTPPKQPLQQEAQSEPQQNNAPNDEQVEESNEGEQQEAAPNIEETFTLDIEGTQYVLPKKLEKAVMQERDYTQKSQTLAEQRKQVELLNEQMRIANFRREFEAEVSTELQQLQAYDSVLKQPVDWSSMTTDEAFRKKLQLDQWKDEREAIEKQLHLKHQQWTQKTQDAVKEFEAKANELVSKRVPNWSEETWKAIREHAKSDGYTDVELGEIRDPRHKLTLWKAQQFDQLKANATKTVQDVKTVRTTPSNPMPPHVKDKLNFRKTLQKTAPNSPERKRAVEGRVASIFSR